MPGGRRPCSNANAMAALIRALTYASLFVGLVLVFLPARVLERSGVGRPEIGVVQLGGIVMVVAGMALALWCVLTFALVGKGTPAPFDPPRRLVVRGPYRFVRNPMYIGAATALAGASLFYESTALAAYTAVFLLIVYLFIRLYEEPTLQRTFGEEYDDYCRNVRRWIWRWPLRSPGERSARRSARDPAE